MSLLHFLAACDTLKRIPRTGWLLRGITPGAAENVAGHSHTTAMIAYFLALMGGEEVDMGRLLVMALIHDLPESRLGDIPHDTHREPADLYESKRRAERQIMEELLEELPAQLRGSLEEAWNELCNAESLEARLVETADRLATALHALQLVESGYPKERLASFFRNAEKAASKTGIPQALELAREIRMATGL